MTADTAKPSHTDAADAEATPEASSYRPLAVDPISGEIPASRKIRRLTHTREIRLRTTHRRRKWFARSGVLASFGLAMVVYPVWGNVVPYSTAAESVPGVVLGEAPTTGHALLGDGPRLVPTVLELPSVDEQAHALAVSTGDYVVSDLLPDCQVLPVDYTTLENGFIPTEQLCVLWDGKSYLQAEAALNLAQLNEQFRATFGRNMCIGEGYRSYQDQVRLRSLRGWLAATPGSSVHGFANAIDLCRGDDAGEFKAWLDENAGAYGWVNPDWAKYRKYEPWHWEYKPFTDALNLYGGGSEEYFGDGAPLTEDETTDPDPQPTQTQDPEPTQTQDPDPTPTDEPDPTPQPTPAP